MPRYTVALGIRGPQVPEGGGAAAFDPLRGLEVGTRVAGEMNQIRNSNAEFAAKMHLGQVYASAPNEEAGMEALRQDPAISFFPEMLTQARQANLAMVQTARERQAMGTSTFENFQKLMPELYQDPSKWDVIKSTVLANTYDPKVRAANEAQLSAYHDAIYGGATNPDGTIDVGKVRTNMLGGMLSWMTPEQSKMYTGSYENVDIGGGSSQMMFRPGIFSSVPPHPIAPPVVGGIAPQAVTGRTEFTPPIVGGMQGSPGTGSIGYGAPGSQTYTPQPAAPAAQPPAAAPPNLVTGGALGVPAPSGPSPIQLPPVDVGAQAPPTAPTPTSPGTMGPVYGVGLDYARDREKKMADVENQLDEAVQTGQSLYRNMTEIYQAAKEAHFGGGADKFMAYAKVLQAMGVDTPGVNAASNGSLRASQVADKLSLNNATDQMKEHLQTGRYNMREFVTFLNSNPNITTDPAAMVQIFNLWNDYYNKDKAEQAALDKAKTQPGFDINRWPATWANSDYMKKFAPGERFSGEGVLGVLPPKARDGVFLPREKGELDEVPNGMKYRLPGEPEGAYHTKGESKPQQPNQ